jgi:hypothetical protein
MAILSFALTKGEFLSGKKTVTRRDWSESHYQTWVRMWDTDRRIHDAYDNIPRAGGSKIGELRLTQRPYRERLSDMPVEDLIAEGGMCSTLAEFYKLIGKSPREYVTVIRFERIA